MTDTLRRAVLAAVLCVPAALAVAAEAPPAYPPFGLDLTARDPRVKPGTDFFRHANGRYLARTPIPADDVVASRNSGISREIEARLHAILEEAARDAAPQPADAGGKAGAFYAAFMDEARIEQLGAKPIAPELDAIRAAPDLAALASLMGRAPFEFTPSVFDISIDVDLKRPDRYAVYLNQSGLGLPDIDYYTQPGFAPQRDAYAAYAARLLRLVGWDDPDGAAAAILAFETRLAQASWTLVQQRDVVAQYHPMTPAELEKLAPEFPWHEFLQAAQLGDKAVVVVAQDTAFPRLAAVTRATPLPVLKAWMAFRTADFAANYLPAAFAHARFELRDHVLAGQQEPRPRWARAVAAVAGGDCLYDALSCFGTLKWAVGRLYVERWFPPATKAKMTDLATNLKSAFRHRIERLDWMGPATRAEALKKLDAVTIKVGWPDTWPGVADIVIRRDDLVGDVRAAAAADWRFMVQRSAGAVDRGEWTMTPQTNDAYSGSLVDIVFPAGVLLPPIFDATADAAVNYGAAGAVIGHELTHHFDDQGRTIDASGALRDWWTPADAAAFKARAGVLGAQYARYEPVPGVHINPDLTMGENLADLGGVSIALDAYHESLHGRPAPVLGGLTGDQRVFLGWAQAWAGKMRPEEIRRITISDPHSYRSFRVNGVVRNIDAWYTAFGIKPGDALWIPPAKRARIW